jgi:zinc transporter, ZIP family
MEIGPLVTKGLEKVLRLRSARWPDVRERGLIGYEGSMAVFVALGAFLMTLAGGWTAQRVTDRRHLVLGLAGGLMLGVVGLDLLPEALRAAGDEVFGVPAALLLFVAGFLLAHLVERLLAARQAAHGGEERDGRAPEVGLTAAAAMVGHSAMDGVAIGAAFQVGGGMGTAVALAVVAHDFADGFNTYTITSLYGNDRRRALGMLFADAAAPVVGAASTSFVTIPEGLLGGYLGLFGGALLYLAAAEILPEAHHEHPAHSTLLCTVAGVGFIWLVVGLAG